MCIAAVISGAIQHRAGMQASEGSHRDQQGPPQFPDEIAKEKS
jgi:hypothetical protein